MLSLSLLALCFLSTKASDAPNIVFFIVDDLGWGNVGYHRNVTTKIPEIKTPNLDRYAKEMGIELNRHYVHPTCTPTRSSFFSGRLPIHVQTSLKGPEESSSGIPRYMQTFPALLKKQGYRNHIVGKWDAGFASFNHTPKGRGFDSSLIYTEHGSEYWTHKIDALVAKCAYYRGYEDLNDLWEHNEENEGPAEVEEGKYVEYLFEERALEIIDDHADKHSDEPLFLMYASHLHHQPLQVPEDEMIPDSEQFPSDPWLCSYSTQYVHENLRNPRDFGCRRIYTSMVRMMDRIFGKLMRRLQTKKLWDNTLVIFTSDNGGSTWLMEGAASNFPLRGGKYSEFEGGTRAVAFLTGGLIPENRLGKKEERMIHVADWYATFASLAGLKNREDILDPNVDDYGYAQIDSLDVSDVIFKNPEEATSPRTQYHLNQRAWVDNEFKIVVGLMDSANLPTVLYPTNGTVFGKSGVDDMKMDCNHGCLFNVVKDPEERFDLSQEEEYVSLAESMIADLELLNAKVWENSDTADDNSCPVCEHSSCLPVCTIEQENGEGRHACVPCGCWMAKYHWGGNIGPYQDVENVVCPEIDNSAICSVEHPPVVPRDEL